MWRRVQSDCKSPSPVLLKNQFTGSQFTQKLKGVLVNYMTNVDFSPTPQTPADGSADTSNVASNTDYSTECYKFIS